MMEIDVIIPYLLISIIWGAALIVGGKVGWWMFKAWRLEKRKEELDKPPHLPDIDEPPKKINNRILMEQDYRR